MREVKEISTAKLDLKKISEARERIRAYVYKTPLEKSFKLSNETKNVLLKLENQQSVKAFKIRGALNKILSLTEEQKKIGIAATSSGNHGISISYGAKLTGVKRAVVIVPKSTPESKLEKIRYFGGELIVEGENYDDANKFGQEYIEKNNLVFVDGWDKDPEIYAGQGTIGLEILEQNPDVDTILVPVGGGGLLSGIAVAAKGIKPSIKIIGVQTEACPAYLKSIEDNKCYGEYPTESSICEALVGGIGQLAFELKENVDEIILVKEASIRQAIAHMANEEKNIVEPSGAITVAAVLEHGDKIPGKNVVAIVSGGNIDNKLLVDILNE